MDGGSLLLRRGHAILKTKLSPVSEGVVWEVRKKEGEEMIYGEAGPHSETAEVVRGIFHKSNAIEPLRYVSFNTLICKAFVEEFPVDGRP